MEMFLRMPGREDYAEINFSPSSCWAAYRFSAYREGMTNLAAEPPAIRLEARGDHVVLEAELVLPGGFKHDSVTLALAAVVEETDGTKTCWALRHPGGEPDFHHGDCFALTLPPTGTS